MTTNLNMRNIQESVEDSAKQAQELGRKAMLSYLGILGFHYDFARSVYTNGWKAFEKAEKRGEKVEKELVKFLQAYQSDFPGEVKKLAQSVEENVTGMAKDVGSQADKLGKNLEKYVTKYVRGSSLTEAVEDIKVNGKSVKEAVEDVAEDVVAKVESAVDKVWAGYDELSVKDVLAGLENKSLADLELVREHEVGNKNRVTVLREIDARLQAMTS